MKDFKRNQLGLAAVSVHGNKLKNITPMFDYLSSQLIHLDSVCTPLSKSVSLSHNEIITRVF